MDGSSRENFKTFIIVFLGYVWFLKNLREKYEKKKRKNKFFNSINYFYIFL